jgi:hypothetical protein
MRLLRQPTVLGELLMGLLLGNLAYLLGNPGVTVLREGDNLRRIANLALSSNVSLSEAALKLLPQGNHAQRIADILSGAKGLDYQNSERKQSQHQLFLCPDFWRSRTSITYEITLERIIASEFLRN